MSLAHVSASVSERIYDAQKTLSHIQSLELAYKQGSIDRITFFATKGNFYILLYACIEHCWSSAVGEYLGSIEAFAQPVSKLGNGLASLALSSQFQAAVDRAKTKKLQSYHQVVDALRGEGIAKFRSGILQSELMSCDGNVIDHVWSLLDLPGAAFSTLADKAIFNEIFERRCAVAHGRETASSVGANITASDLVRRLSLTQIVISNWLATLENQLNGFNAGSA